MFQTDRRGRALQHLVHHCPSAGDWYLTADVLSDFLYSTPDNWDPQTCWTCVNGQRPQPSTPTIPPGLPGCPSYPTPVGGPGSFDPDGVITRWVWTINGSVWYDGWYPEVTLLLPPGMHEVMLTVHDDDGLSDSASAVTVVEGGMPLPAFIPMDQQINLHEPSDPAYDTIKVEAPAWLEFLNDGMYAFTRTQISTNAWWYGPVIDLPMACHAPVDVFADPNLVLRFAARYYQGPEYEEPYSNAPIYVSLRDALGYTADLGALYGPAPDPAYPAWQEIEAPIDFVAMDEGFDPGRVTQIVFYGLGLHMAMPKARFGEAYVDIRDVYLGPGAPCPGDCNGDLHVDWADWLIVHPCVQGPEVGLAPGCECADADLDADVDLADMAAFQRCFDGGR
jgi:hypothetical protein